MSTVRYGHETATETPAGGVSGMLCKSIIDGRITFFFRVTAANGETQDYDLRHDDLSITIAQDELASFYRLENGKQILDHPSSVLGLSKVEGISELHQ
jgi:hypothetical protein